MSKYCVQLKSGECEMVDADYLRNIGGGVICFLVVDDNSKYLENNIVAVYAPGEWVKVIKE